MIQIKRGSTAEWKNLDDRYKYSRLWNPDKSLLLADGQPGYDKTNHILKIGDGEHTWGDLKPISSELSIDDLICEESEAADRKLEGKLIDDAILITYGEDAPSSNMTGKVYLHIETEEPQPNYVIQQGTTTIEEDTQNGYPEVTWKYQVCQDNTNDTVFVKCWTTIEHTAKFSNYDPDDPNTDIDWKQEQEQIIKDKDIHYLGAWDAYNLGAYIEKYRYPFQFSTMPVETATVAPVEFEFYRAWLTCFRPPKGPWYSNCYSESGAYLIMRTLEDGPDPWEEKDFIISITVEGELSKSDWENHELNNSSSITTNNTTNAQKVTCYLTN